MPMMVCSIGFARGLQFFSGSLLKQPHEVDADKGTNVPCDLSRGTVERADDETVGTVVRVTHVHLAHIGNDQ